MEHRGDDGEWSLEPLYQGRQVVIGVYVSRYDVEELLDALKSGAHEGWVAGENWGGGPPWRRTEGGEGEVDRVWGAWYALAEVRPGYRLECLVQGRGRVVEKVWVQLWHGGRLVATQLEDVE